MERILNMFQIIVPDSFKLKISNFGPITDIELDIFRSNYSVFIGPNASGKSSIFNVLLLVKDIIDSIALDKLLDQSFRERLVLNQSSGKTAEITFSFLLSESIIDEWMLEPYGLADFVIHLDLGISYTLIISTSQISEELSFINLVSGKQLLIARKDDFTSHQVCSDFQRDDYIWLFDEQNVEKSNLKRIPKTGRGNSKKQSLWSLVTSIQQIALPLAEMKSFFSFFYILKPSRSALPKGEVFPDATLHPDGSNLCTVLHRLYSNEPTIFHKIEFEFKKLFSDVASILTPITSNNEISLKAIFRLENHEKYEVWIDELSTGFLEVLQLLTFFFSNPANSILLIEEIERALHPGLQIALLNIFLENIEQRTLILATHSSHVLRSNLSGERSWFLVTGGKLSSLAFTSQDEWYELNHSLGIDPRQLFFSKGIIFCEGPSELSLSEIIDMDNNIERDTVTLVVISGSSAIKHQSFKSFLQFLTNSTIPFLLCFDKDIETRVKEFVNTNPFVDRKQLVIWEREFEEALGIEEYIDSCSTDFGSNPAITTDDVRSKIMEGIDEDKLLSRSVTKAFRELHLGPYNKPEMARKTVRKMIKELDNDEKKELPAQLKEFIEKLGIFAR